MSDLSAASPAEEAAARTVDETIAQELVERARSEGAALVGPRGLLDRTKASQMATLPRTRGGGPIARTITTHRDA